ncbi:MAG: cytochrome-c peroxidase, partial [Myxococcales bacterium]|nr:cytochrome-c peroxidase [Myxococcales bacterium]
VIPTWLDSAWTTRDNTPVTNPITDAGATLGRVLFYDTRLSANHTVACATCHVQALGFSDDLVRSVGFEGGLTGRRSMPLVNVAAYQPGRMFWDERATSVEDQVLRPIQDSVEMGLTLPELVSRVESAPWYPDLFEDAFGDSTVTSDRISLALAQFVRSIVSTGSRYDEGIVLAGGNPAADFSNFTTQENRGKQLFFGDGNPGCVVCHLDRGPPPAAPNANPGVFQPLFARINGLNDTADDGIGGQNGIPNDVGRFKAPSLRNVALRAPYMHDGSRATLLDVVEFYDHEVANVPGLDGALIDAGTGQPRVLNLSTDDKAALVAFLETLTDLSITTDPRFSDPFQR